MPIQNFNENLEKNTLRKFEVTHIFILEILIGKCFFSTVPLSAIISWAIPTFSNIEITSNGQNKFLISSQTKVLGKLERLLLAIIYIKLFTKAAMIDGSIIEPIASRLFSRIDVIVFILPND